MKIKLRKNYDFICGHMFSKISHDKLYDVVDTWSSYKFIIDDEGNKIGVSGSAFRSYFKEVK